MAQTSCVSLCSDTVSKMQFGFEWENEISHVLYKMFWEADLLAVLEQQIVYDLSDSAVVLFWFPNETAGCRLGLLIKQTLVKIFVIKAKAEDVLVLV